MTPLSAQIRHMYMMSTVMSLTCTLWLHVVELEAQFKVACLINLQYSLAMKRRQNTTSGSQPKRSQCVNLLQFYGPSNRFVHHTLILDFNS